MQCGTHVCVDFDIDSPHLEQQNHLHCDQLAWVIGIRQCIYFIHLYAALSRLPASLRFTKLWMRLETRAVASCLLDLRGDEGKKYFHV